MFSSFQSLTSSSEVGANSHNMTAQQVLSQARSFMSKGEYYNCIQVTDNHAQLAKDFIGSTGTSTTSSSTTSTSSTAKNAPNIIERERLFGIRAEAYLAVKQFAKAEKEARLGIQASESTSPQAHFCLGAALLGQFKVSEAVDAFDVAESLMASPQPWKYVVLPEDDVNVVTNGTNHHKTSSSASSQQNQVLSRKLRDVGATATSSSSSSSTADPLLPPPPITYEWQNQLNSWRADASLARKLDQAQSSRLLPSSGLLQGVRMLEQYAKQTSSKFLILTLRNDTDYDLVYQFHTCGSEAATLLAKSASGSSSSSSVAQSQTQYLIKFPHVIPPSSIGVAIIYTDSWRAKTITLSSTVTFSMQSSAKMMMKAKRNTHQQQASSPQIRFSFSLTSVMSNITANVMTIPVSTSSPVKNNNNDQSQQQQPTTASSFSFDKSAFSAFALNQLPSQLYSRAQTSGGISATQSDVLKIPAVYLSVIQKPGGLKVDNSGSTTTRLSTTLIASIAQYLPPKPLRLSSCISQTWKNVVSSFPPNRFDDFPFGSVLPEYSLGRDVRSSPFTVRNPVANIKTTATSNNNRNNNNNNNTNKEPLTQWFIKREDSAMFKTLVFRNARGEALLYIVGEPGKGNDYQIRHPGGHQGRSVLCRVTSTQGLFKSNRTADVLWANQNFDGDSNDSENLTNVKTAKISHKILADDQLQLISVNMKALIDEQQQQMINNSAAASSSSAGSPLTNGAPSGPSFSSSSKSEASSSSSFGGGGTSDQIIPGLELIAPRYQSIISSKNNSNKSTPGNLVTIRDIASKHTVATLEQVPNTSNDPQQRGSYCLSFLSQTDALFCSMLSAEFIVAW